MMIILEAYSVITRKTKSIDIAELFRSQLVSWLREGKTKLYGLNRERFKMALDILFHHNYDLHAGDAVLLAMQKELKLPLITFDKVVERIAKLL